MSFSSILKKVFGDKSSRDLKAIAPILKAVKEKIPEVQQLDNDGLRHCIESVRADIASATQADKDAADKLRAEVESLPFEKRQPLWDQIDAVTVLLGREGFEVTTYRIDGEYQDGRHPSEVSFTPNLLEDLKRRDFTINAMAC